MAYFHFFNVVVRYHQVTTHQIQWILCFAFRTGESSLKNDFPEKLFRHQILSLIFPKKFHFLFISLCSAKFP